MWVIPDLGNGVSTISSTAAEAFAWVEQPSFVSANVVTNLAERPWVIDLDGYVMNYLI
jgi:hypothetical protein